MNLEQFFEEEKHTALYQKWVTDKEKQTRLRIRLAISAYAYEIMNHSIMSVSYTHLTLPTILLV